MDKKLTTICASAASGAFLAILCLGSLSGCNKKGQILAYVNGQPISLKEFYEYVQNKPQVTVDTENGKIMLPVDESIGYQAAKDEINQMVELQIAKEKGLLPTDQEIEAEIKRKLKREPSYLLDLESRGITTDFIKKSVEADLAVEKILTQGITVTTDDAKKYVKAHPKEFMEPARIDLSYIAVKEKSNTEKVDEELATGQSFTQTALEFSEVPTAHSYNGRFSDPSKPLPTVNSLPAILQSALAPLHEDESTGWIKFSDAYAKFYVNKRLAPKPIALSSDTIEELRRSLAKAKGAQVHNLNAMILQKLKDSKVEILQDGYKAEWAAERSE